MKKALMALVLTAFAYAGAEAQTNCKVVPKKKVVSTTTATTTNTCKLVPMNVCTISPDRRSVTCYKSVDPDHFEKYGTQTTYYGPTGPVPGQKAQFETETVVIKGDEKSNYCVRNDEERATYCYYSGHRICRDANGFYSICFAPADNNIDNRTSKVNARKTKNSGNNGVVLK